MKIPDLDIQKLKDRGLFVSNPKSSTHSYPDGVMISKPNSISGNTLPGYTSAFYDVNDVTITFDAPYLWLFGNDGVWMVLSKDFTPGPGPGDFIDEWNSLDEAVQDIIDFYFGDPKRMEIKASIRKGLPLQLDHL
jgi:hypothetical protein